MNGMESGYYAHATNGIHMHVDSAMMQMSYKLLKPRLLMVLQDIP